MLVILTDEHILEPQQVCQGCLLADQRGFPRWHHGRLGCGHALGRAGNNLPKIYECEMGFRVANINGDMA